MIIQCRPSSPSPHEVRWISFEMRGIRHKVKTAIVKSERFNTYMDAAGFASGLQKRGVNGISIRKLS